MRQVRLHPYAASHPDEFGGRLARLRAERHLSRRDLADASGVAAGAIAFYETGRRRLPTRQNVAKLARALNVDPSALFAADSQRGLIAVRVVGCFPTVSTSATPTPAEILIPEGVFGMTAVSPAVYARKVVGSILECEGIHDGEYILIDPDAPAHPGVFLLDGDDAARLAKGGDYWVVHHADGRTETTETAPDVHGRIVKAYNVRDID
jgi:transcriptional regulator with XRE-family HTH domain